MSVLAGLFAQHDELEAAGPAAAQKAGPSLPPTYRFEVVLDPTETQVRDFRTRPRAVSQAPPRAARLRGAPTDPTHATPAGDLLRRSGRAAAAELRLGAGRQRRQPLAGQVRFRSLFRSLSRSLLLTFGAGSEPDDSDKGSCYDVSALRYLEVACDPQTFSEAEIAVMTVRGLIPR